MAEERGVRAVSFLAISTGIYGYPLEEAAAIALREVKAHLEKADTKLQKVVLVLFGKAACEVYARLWNASAVTGPGMPGPYTDPCRGEARLAPAPHAPPAARKRAD